MTRDEYILFLLGKMDGLRFPELNLVDHGERLCPYKEVYIQELLDIRAELLGTFSQPEEQK